MVIYNCCLTKKGDNPCSLSCGTFPCFNFVVVFFLGIFFVCFPLIIVKTSLFPNNQNVDQLRQPAEFSRGIIAEEDKSKKDSDIAEEVSLRKERKYQMQTAVKLMSKSFLVTERRKIRRIQNNYLKSQSRVQHRLMEDADKFKERLKIKRICLKCET